MNLVNFIIVTIIISSVAAWCLTLGYKWNVIEWVQVHAPCDLIHKMFSCQFCLSWWTCVGLSLVAVIVTCCWWYMLVPFVSTKFAQCLIK